MRRLNSGPAAEAVRRTSPPTAKSIVLIATVRYQSRALEAPYRVWDRCPRGRTGTAPTKVAMEPTTRPEKTELTSTRRLTSRREVVTAANTCMT